MRSEGDAFLSVQRFFAGLLPEPWDVRVDVEAGGSPDRPFALVELAGSSETSGAPVAQDLIVPIVANLFLPHAGSRGEATNAALALREEVWQAVKWGPDPRNPTTDRIPLYCYDPRVECHRFKAWRPFTITVAGETTDLLTPPVTAADVAAAVGAAIGANPGDVTGQDRGGRLWDVFYGGDLAGDRIGTPTVSEGDGWARVMLEGAPVPWRGPSDYMKVSSFSQNTVPDDADPTLVMVAVDLRLTFARGLPLPLDLRVLQRISATADSGPGG